MSKLTVASVYILTGLFCILYTYKRTPATKALVRQLGNVRGWSFSYERNTRWFLTYAGIAITYSGILLVLLPINLAGLGVLIPTLLIFLISDRYDSTFEDSIDDFKIEYNRLKSQSTSSKEYYYSLLGEWHQKSTDSAIETTVWTPMTFAGICFIVMSAAVFSMALTTETGQFGTAAIALAITLGGGLALISIVACPIPALELNEDAELDD